ncbi:hypothetical protein PHAVU_010G051400, partial [Phaseolus vulgaris]
RGLWKVFQRWGRILDVFISRKLNARNRRFGFVRFHGVSDAHSLERKLDAIWIGTWKLQSGIRRGNKSNNYPFLKSWRFPVDMESSSWLKGCFIGHLRESAKLQSIKESFILGGFSLVRVRLLGENLFSELSPWRDSFVVPERFAWVHCRGIPLQLWCNQCFISIGSLVGEVIEVNAAIEKNELLEFARVRVKIQMPVRLVW